MLLGEDTASERLILFPPSKDIAMSSRREVAASSLSGSIPVSALSGQSTQE